MKYDVHVYSKPACVQCDATKRWLNKNNVEYQEHNLLFSDDVLEMAKELGYTSAPVVILENPDTKARVTWAGFVPSKLKGFLA